VHSPVRPTRARALVGFDHYWLVLECWLDGPDRDQHSVRGFLAGTVKKKLGFSLTTSKAAGDVRRYRIETRRGR
jgi:uncharacterized protein DUF3489